MKQYKKTKRIKSLLSIAELISTTIISDMSGTNFVILSNAKCINSDNIGIVADKTEFEAVFNHVHIIDNISKIEMDVLYQMAEPLCDMILAYLCKCYPDRDFYVYAQAVANDSLSFRFHQIWKNEEPYLYPKRTEGEWIVCKSFQKNL